MRIHSCLAILVLAAACNSRQPGLAVSPRSAIALTGGPNTSLIALARTDSGVVAIDLGWWGYRKPFTRALASLNATPADVRAVFITHSHRDHITAWPEVRGATFYMGEAERARMFGSQAHRGWMVRLAERMKSTNLPDSSRLDVRTFRRDTSFVIGHDTVWAFIVPGHTAGSAVYLMRGVLYAGDAVTHSALKGFKPAKAQFSDDPKLAAANLATLWSRVPLEKVRVLCTAHAECTAFTPAVVKKLGGGAGPLSP